MSRFFEYQTIASQTELTADDLQRLASIVEEASLDASLMEAIMAWEYLSAQEDDLLSDGNIREYNIQTRALKQLMKEDIQDISSIGKIPEVLALVSLQLR